MTIKRQLNLSYSVAFFILVGAIVAGVSILTYRLIYQQATANLDALVTDTRNLLEIDFSNVVKNYLKGIAETDRQTVEYFYQQYKSGHISEAEAKREAAAALLSQTIGMTGYVYCLDSSGVIQVHPKAALIGQNLSANEFIQEQKAKKHGYIEYDWANPGETVKRPKALYMDYFAPWDWIISASSYRSEFANLINVADFSKGILDIKIGSTGYLFLLGANGTLVVHPTMQGVNIADNKDSRGHYYVREMLEKKNGVIRYFWKNPGETREREKIVYYRSIEELNVIVAGGSYTDELFLANSKIFLLAGIVFVIGLGLLYLVGNLIANRFSKPIRSVGTLIQAIGRGDLTSEATTDFEKKMLVRDDEFGEMARTAFETQARLRELSSAVRRNSEAIRNGASDIGFSIDAQAAASSQMSASVAEITSTTEELSASSTQIAEHSGSVVDIANLTWENSKRGSESMVALRQKIENIKNDNEVSLAEIVELGRKSKEISKVMAIINTIADQTKLIAFNAALEAASAGEAGKRFGVVASEIRRLADSVTDSTSEIETRIGEIQDSISRLVITSEKGAEGIADGIEATAVADDLLGELVDAASRTTDAAQQISLSTQQQKTASGQVVLALREIVAASQNTASSIAKIAEISHAMTVTAVELNEVVSVFKLTREA
ncbi:MAG: methyl-accepting chemotaxis protein [Treponema sp.]|nr:methyl-accepting chemotaxis protein [Treponema sp.]